MIAVISLLKRLSCINMVDIIIIIARLQGAFIIGFCTTKGNLPYKLSVPMHVKPSKPGSQLEKRFLNERHSRVTSKEYD